MELTQLEKKLTRAIAARKQAEKILEDKALELFALNQQLEKQVEQRTEQLAQSEIKYRSMIENMELGILEVNEEGKIIKAYPRFCEMIGYSAEELEGKDPLITFVVPEYWAILEQQSEERSRGESGTYQIQLKRKDGELIWVVISGAPFFDMEGNLEGTVGIHFDITDSIRLRSELQKAKIIAERARKAEKTFLANMSHEIRTPLNAIIGMSHLLRDTELNTDQLEHLDILSSSANILQALISDILDLSKIDAGKMEIRKKPVNLPELLSKVEKTFKVRLDSKPVEISKEVDENIKYLILSDELILNQIFLNLVGNAEKFTKKGKIKVTAKIEKETPTSYEIKFEVQDTGIGITKAKQKEIFEEFKQATPNIASDYGGTGLGLAITKKLITQLGGEISVISQENVGSTFHFNLTFNKSNKLIENSKNVYSTEINFRSEKDPILVVEDNILNQKYLTKLLEKWNLSYELADNGKIGVELSQAKKYSLILMDIQMPVMDGYEATKNVRKATNPNLNTPIIALTASTLLNKKQEAMEQGMNDYVAKPFDPSQLANVLSKFLILDTKKVQPPNKKIELDREYLQLMYGDDLEYAQDIFQTFLEITPDEFVILKDNVEIKDFQKIKETSHKIKPTFTMVGLKEISLKFQDLESAALQEEEEKVNKLFEDIDNSMPHYLSSVESELNRILGKLKEV